MRNPSSGGVMVPRFSAAAPAPAEDPPRRHAHPGNAPCERSMPFRRSSPKGLLRAGLASSTRNGLD
jgi:hypothetical protein